MSMYGLGMYEYRGKHTVHDRAEKAEAALSELEGFVKQRLGYWENIDHDSVATELRLMLVKIHDLKNS